MCLEREDPQTTGGCRAKINSIAPQSGVESTATPLQCPPATFDGVVSLADLLIASLFSRETVPDEAFPVNACKTPFLALDRVTWDDFRQDQHAK